MIRDYLNYLKQELQTAQNIKTSVHNGNFSEQDLNRIINATPQIIISPVNIKAVKLLDSTAVKKDLNLSIFVVLKNYEFDAMLDLLQKIELQLFNLKAKNSSPITSLETQNLYSSSLDKNAVNMWAINYSVEIYQNFAVLDNLTYGIYSAFNLKQQGKNE